MKKAMAQEKRIATIVRRQVTSVLREILSDPDAGLPLRRKTVLRLQQSLQSKKEGKLRDLSEVLSRYHAAASFEPRARPSRDRKRAVHECMANRESS